VSSCAGAWRSRLGGDGGGSGAGLADDVRATAIDGAQWVQTRTAGSDGPSDPEGQGGDIATGATRAPR
jgi:hypothetical protein